MYEICIWEQKDSKQLRRLQLALIIMDHVLDVLSPLRKENWVGAASMDAGSTKIVHFVYEMKNPYLVHSVVDISQTSKDRTKRKK